MLLAASSTRLTHTAQRVDPSVGMSADAARKSAGATTKWDRRHSWEMRRELDFSLSQFPRGKSYGRDLRSAGLSPPLPFRREHAQIVLLAARERADPGRP